jgi:hypothetical protein
MAKMKRPWLLLVAALVVLSVLALYFRKKSASENVNANVNESVNVNGKGTANANPQPAKAKPSPVMPKTVDGKAVITGKWGSQPGEFGRRADPESNPEGPMAVVAGRNGEIDVVDQINRRVQRFKDGKPIGSISMGGDTVQDAIAGKDGRMLLLDRLADQNVQVYGPDGKLQNELPIVGKGIPEGGGVTGVFSDDDGIYVEREHGTVVRIADATGVADPNRPEMVGRPSRDGRQLLQAQLTNRATGDITVIAFDRASNQAAWSQSVSLGAMVMHIITLDSDRSGNVYLAVDVGEESPQPPYTINNERVVIMRFGAGGTPRGSITIPPFGSADETFRPITVDDDGSVLVMTSGPKGISVTRYTFP